MTHKIILSSNSDRSVIHCELDLTGSNITAEPGDSLAVIPRNDPYAVEQFLQAAGLAAHGGARTTGSASTADRASLAQQAAGWELRFPSAALLQAASAAEPRGLIAQLTAAGPEIWAAWLKQHTVADVLATLHQPLPQSVLVGVMSPVRPRAYSVASSHLSHPNAVHLTVAVDYHHGAAMRSGVAGGYLADRVEPGDRIAVFLLPNRGFHLPADSAAPLIMIGPGVGVAPFRAFIQHRAAQGDPGLSWLFYGNRHRTTDFFYETEWQKRLRSGILTRLDTAFSRDQAHKMYVQHRIREQAAEIIEWIEAGAYWYVCGDARQMASAVASELTTILTDAFGAAEAATQLAILREENRYRHDVY